VLLVRLIPAGAPTNLSADVAAGLLRRVRPRNPIQATLRALAVELVAEIRHLDRRISTAGEQITTAVAATGSTLTGLYGIGPLLAGKILARVGAVTRFRSPTAFAAEPVDGLGAVFDQVIAMLHHSAQRADRLVNLNPVKPAGVEGGDADTDRVGFVALAGVAG